MAEEMVISTLGSESVQQPNIPQHLIEGHTHPRQYRVQMIGEGGRSSHAFADEQRSHPSYQAEHHIYITVCQNMRRKSDKLHTLNTSSERYR